MLDLRKIILIIFVLSLRQTGISHAQDSAWTLQECLVYARDHNLSISEAALNERISRMQYEESRLSQLPGLSLSSSYGKSFGRSINPTTNEFENRTYSYTGFNGSSSVLLFGWFRKRNEIAQNKYFSLSSSANLDQLKDEVSLNVATGYLRILLAAEQIKINERQLEVSRRQVEKTELLLRAGRSNGLDKSQVITQLSIDSSNYFKAFLSYRQSIIELKAILNLGMEIPFEASFDGDIEIPVHTFLETNPKSIYQIALEHLGNIKSSSYKIQAAEKNIAMSKGNLYPQISLGGSAGTNYSSTYYQSLPYGQIQLMPWGKQLQNNFSQSVSLSLSIPVFSGLSKRYAVKRAKIARDNAFIQDEKTRLQLQQHIYSAYNEAQTALQTYYASNSIVGNARLGYQYAEKRYDKGLISAVDLVIAQNTQYKAESDQASAKYDLLFKLFVIDFYLGNDIFLQGQ